MFFIDAEAIASVRDGRKLVDAPGRSQDAMAKFDESNGMH